MHPENPAAGDVPFPTDPAEIRLAKYSGGVIWRAFPYFNARYGARGARFAISDAGYLVVIARKRPGFFVEQVLWLARVLAARGMPSWLLECQLHHLARAGERSGWPAVPTTLEGLVALQERRRAAVSDVAFEQAGRVFADAMKIRRALVAGLGTLLASAVADVDAGLCRSTAPFVDWVLALEPAPGPIAAGVSAVFAHLGRPGKG